MAGTQSTSSIVQKHRNLQKLFDNMWLHLFVLDIQTGAFARYLPTGKWSTVETAVGVPHLAHHIQEGSR